MQERYKQNINVCRKASNEMVGLVHARKWFKNWAICIWWKIVWSEEISKSLWEVVKGW